MKTEGADGADLDNGVAVDRLADGEILPGKVAGEKVVLVRRGSEFFALGASCTHYGGPLAKGLVVGDGLRCPLHHACFSLRTGEALRTPAFDPVPCWRVERIGDTVFVREKLPAPARRQTEPGKSPAAVVIVGGGGAGFAAADTLRREGYDGPVTILSADDSPPCDRPNLSKDYLEGKASEDWIPLRPPEYYRDQRIELVLSSRVSVLDAPRKQVSLENGKTYQFDKLLLATGADPVKLPIAGAADSQVHYLRTYADSRDIATKAASAKQVVIVGASFIALEVAASLRGRGVAVHVVGRDRQPLQRVFGPQLGEFVRALHEAHGVVFHLEDSVTRVEGGKAILASGATLDADFIVMGVGVRPALALAEQAGLQVDRGVMVNEYLESSVPGIFAAGDIARWPDPHSGALVRIEHWVVALRQGQAAARNILGRRERFSTVPFFWTRQFGVSIKYVGHAEQWDEVEISGSLEAKNCSLTYKLAGRALAVASVGQDLRNLQAEAALETQHPG